MGNAIELPNEKIVKTAKNSMLEFLRFVFSFWVVYYHSFFIFKDQFFGWGYISVDFFFILGGFFFLGSFQSVKNLPFFKGVGTFLWKRFKSISFIFLICMIFAVWYWVEAGVSWNLIDAFGYLWYIPFYFLAFFVFFALRKLVKNNNIFVAICLLIAILCYVLYWTVITKNGLLRAFGGVGLGIALSFLPALNLKFKKINWNLIVFILLFFGTIILMALPDKKLWCEIVLMTLMFPALIYFGFQVKIKIKLFNYLGALSFGLYSFQCVLRILEFYGLTNTTVLFVILLTLTVIVNTKSFRKIFMDKKILPNKV